MKRLILLMLAVWSLSLHAGEKKNDAEFFARIVPDRETVYAGDSMLVSVVLYATYPIAKAECTTDFKVKGNGNCRTRKLSINRNATASRVRENGRIYYTLVWAQYVVAPATTGKYTIPQQKFKGTLQQVVSMPDMFDQMMGARPQYKNHSVNGSSESFSFEATEKPLRSTQELMHSSGTLL